MRHMAPLVLAFAAMVPRAGRVLTSITAVVALCATAAALAADAARASSSMLAGPTMWQAAVPPAAPAVTHAVVHSFGGGDGAAPDNDLLFDAAGNLYGSTLFGPGGGGTVYAVHSPGRRSASAFETLFSFDGTDGQGPEGIAMDASGTIYGVTLLGGLNECFDGCGVVFRLSPPAKAGGAWTESTLYAFHGGVDAQQPVGPPVLDRDGNLFGVTQFGGTANDGAVFELARSGGGYTEKVIYSLPGGTGGSTPQAGLTIDRQGRLYGSATNGGDLSRCSNAGCGLVFALVPHGATFVPRLVHDFEGCTPPCDRDKGADGAYPFAPVTVDEKSGVIFGTTQYGGSDNNGAVYALLPRHDGTYREHTLASFCPHRGQCPDEAYAPEGKLLLRRDGTLFGTAARGGPGCHGIGCGAVYRLTPARDGYAFGYVYEFGTPIDGADPETSGLVMDATGALFGTTRSGGTQTTCSDGGPGGALGCGTLYRVVP